MSSQDGGPAGRARGSRPGGARVDRARPGQASQDGRRGAGAPPDPVPAVLPGTERFESSGPAAGAWAALSRAHAVLVPRLDQALQRATGLPLRWCDVLLELAAAPGRRMSMTELAERVMLSRSRISRIVDELDGAGLVRRQANPGDGRSAMALLTDAGYGQYRRAAPQYLAAIEAEFAGRLTGAELTAVATALRKMTGPGNGPA